MHANTTDFHPIGPAESQHEPPVKRGRIDPAYLILFISLVAIFAWQFKRFG